jgi:hypothetical protein
MGCPSSDRRRFVRRALPPLAVVAAIAASSNIAGADGVVVSGELALEGGFATRPDTRDASLGPGGGIRAGVTLSGFYVGARLFSYSYGSAGAIDDYATSTMLMLGGDVGFGFGLGDRWILRPQVGVGMALIESEGHVDSGGSYSESGLGGGLYIEPGLAVLCLLGHAFVGADVNGFTFTPNTNDLRPVFATHLQLGVRF